MPLPQKLAAAHPKHAPPLPASSPKAARLTMHFRKPCLPTALLVTPAVKSSPSSNLLGVCLPSHDSSDRQAQIAE